MASVVGVDAAVVVGVGEAFAVASVMGEIEMKLGCADNTVVKLGDLSEKHLGWNFVFFFEN